MEGESKGGRERGREGGREKRQNEWNIHYFLCATFIIEYF